MCLHPHGKLACTGQVASAVAHSSPWLAVWDVDTLELQQTVGYVPDEAKKDGSLVPFYERSVCAAAFSPDGQLLIAVGCDDQHTIGVWKWATGHPNPNPTSKPKPNPNPHLNLNPHPNPKP